MKKNIFLVIVLTAMTFIAKSQNHAIGFKNGLNITNATTLKADNRYGYGYGFVYEFSLQNKYLLGIDLLFDQRGFDSRYTFSDNNGIIQPTVIIESYSDYLSVPIKIGYLIGNKFQSSINFGITPSFLINAQLSAPLIDDLGKITGEFTYDPNVILLKFDMGGLVDIGLSYEIIDKLKMFSSIMYRQSFTSFYKEHINQTIRHTGISISYGLKYQIN